MRHRRDIAASPSALATDGDDSKHRHSSSIKRTRFNVFDLLKVFVLLGVGAVTCLVVFLLYAGRLGFARSFLSRVSLFTLPPLLAPGSIEVVASLEYPPGNIAVSRYGRVFFTFHPEYKPPVQVAELKVNEKSTFVAYPSNEFNLQHFKTCLSLRISYESVVYDDVAREEDGTLWILDFASHAVGRLVSQSYAAPSMHSFHLSNNSHRLTYIFPDVIAGPGSMLNDFAVDSSQHRIYIADTSIVSGSPALVIYDYKQGVSYRLLAGFGALLGSSYSLSIIKPGEDAMSSSRSGKMRQLVALGPFGLTIGIDTLALTRDRRTLYFGALSSSRLYSLNTDHISDALRLFTSGADEASSAAAEAYLRPLVRLQSSDKPISDGASTDCRGSLLLTSIEHGAVVIMQPPDSSNSNGADPRLALSARILLTNSTLLRWPDGLSFGPDGLYVTSSALHYKLLGQSRTSGAPYYICRIAAEHITAATGCDTQMLAGH